MNHAAPSRQIANATARVHLDTTNVNTQIGGVQENGTPGNEGNEFSSHKGAEEEYLALLAMVLNWIALIGFTGLSLPGPLCARSPPRRDRPQNDSPKN